MFRRLSIAAALALAVLISNCGPDPVDSALTIASLTDTVPIVETASIGTVPGSADVTQDGLFQYTIPIEVPPGRAGMEPHLAIRYSSGAPEAVLGIGFTLDGLSSISRCPRTFAQDGERRDVELDATDRFCLDGIRLVAEGATVYGSAAATYRPESGPLIRVTELTRSEDSSQPNTFLVQMPDGRERRYGASPLSRVTVPVGGSEVITTWLLAEERDAVGNTISYRWDQITPTATPEDGAVGNLVRISEIRYTGFTSTAGLLEGTRKVRFSYAERPRRRGVGVALGDGLASPAAPEDAYRYGVRWWRASVFPLERIETFVEDSLVHRYNLHGSDDPVTLQFRLDDIELCTSAPAYRSAHHEPITTSDGLVCLPPTRFRWRGRPVGGRGPNYPGDYQRDPRYGQRTFQRWTVPLARRLADVGREANPVGVLDFNGDGADDILYYGASSSLEIVLGVASERQDRALRSDQVPFRERITPRISPFWT
jgi:hypothetical protein